MPVNFFNVSAKYREHFGKFGNIAKRHDIVANHLNAQYGFGRRGGKERALEEAIAAGCRKATEPTLNQDVSKFRTAYLYFNGTEVEQERVKRQLEDGKDPAVGPLQMLLDDGFTDWEEIRRAAAEWEAQVAAATKDAASTTEAAAPTSDESLPAPTGLEAISAPAGVVLQPGEGALPAAWYLVSSEAMAHLFRFLDSLEEMLRKLRERSAVLGKLLADARDENSVLEELFTLTSREVEELRCRIGGGPSAAVRTVETFPQLERLEDLADSTADVLEIAGKPEAQQILEQLPKQGAHESYRNRSFVYGPKFQVALLKLPQEQQTQVLKAIDLFATKGWKYPSLHNKKATKGTKVSQSPDGSLFFRASQELRVSWTYDDAAVTFHAVFPRGDAGWSEG